MGRLNDVPFSLHGSFIAILMLSSVYLSFPSKYYGYIWASITPGTVLIILAGRFMGKRVVFLKQLPSGLLLVTATSTKVDISGVNVAKFDDKYFGKELQKKKKKGEGEFFEAEKEEKNVLPQEKKDDQKAVDTQLIKAIEGVADLKAYMAARFSLKAGMKPHELKF
ncbi:60S ribosomal protein L6 [Morella rubra]|uniref:60S ribosomal protein L6 n=1 Tax=Morella rubra TaxID=262757 RepID=A0A6A1VZB0_9ROSI|nr:60S ribosomal protein L6 [Morella rubra]